MLRRLMYTVVSVVLLLAADTSAGDCIAFRGDWSGKAKATNLPITWNDADNVVWKRALPGPGTSGPVVVDGRIYVTCYTGYAESIEEPGEKDDLIRHLICLDRESGKVMWTKSFTAAMPESDYRPGNNSRHGYASSTPTTDGKRLYLFFGISGVYCLDLEGEVLWHKQVGDGTHGWGSGTSPLLYNNLLIVNASVECRGMIAFDKLTGDEVWRIDGISKCWASPVLVGVGGGEQELVLNVPHELTGYDPATGEKLWHCAGIPDNYVCPTVIAEGDVVYAIGGRRNTAIAVRAGGRGDVTDSHVLWSVGKGSNVSSPVYVDGHLYWFHESRGMAICLNAKTGEVVFEERLDPRPGLMYASVLAADGKLYGLSQKGGTYVLEATPQFKQLAVNQFHSDSHRANSSPVVSDNQILLRTDHAIYCLGK